jgi:hypothetical protein
MRFKRLLAVCLFAFTVAPANASTYDVNFNFFAFDTSFNPKGTVSVTGTIVTTCDACLIVGADVTSWSFSWSGPTSATTGTASGTAVGDNGTSPLSAGNGHILFSPISTATITFTDAVNGTSQALFGPNLSGFCMSFGCFKFQDSTGSGEAVGQFLGLPVTIATEEIPGAPLPGALPLFATGLGALGLLGWRKKKKAAALAARSKQ